MTARPDLTPLAALLVLAIAASSPGQPSPGQALPAQDPPTPAQTAGRVPPPPPFGRVGAVTPGWDQPHQVEELVEDGDPLGVGLREIQGDLRQPAKFDALYRIPGREDLMMRVDGGLYAIFPRSVYIGTRFGWVPTIPNGTVFYIGRPQPGNLAAHFPPPVTFGMTLSAQSGAQIGALASRTDAAAVRTAASRATLRLDDRRHFQLDNRVTLATAADDAPGGERTGDLEPALKRRPSRRLLPRPGDGVMGGLMDGLTIGPRLMVDPEYRASRLRDLMRRAATADQAARGESSSSK